MRVFLASSNEGKLRELRVMAPPASGQAPPAAGQAGNLEIELLPGFENILPAREAHDSFALNAIEKALYYSHHAGELVCADDSGLSVDALGGAPGVRSARFAGEQATDEDNNRKLVEELKDVPEEKRTARYVCVLALARQGALMALFSGRCDGRILDRPRGTGGFGYDPYFFFPPLGKTLAEITDEAKNRVSHRGKAFQKLIAYLKEH